jgi:hypothetical protein
MSNDITALRAHLFGALEALRDKQNPMEVDRARAISDLAQTVINTAKVELDFLKHTGAEKSHFVPPADGQPRIPAPAPQGAMPSPDTLPALENASEAGEVRQARTGTVVRDHAAGVTRHRME